MNKTTATEVSSPDLEKLNANMARIEELSQRLVKAMATRKSTSAALEAPGPDLALKASAAWWSDALHNPAKLVEQQVNYWGQALTHFIEAQQVLAQGKLEPPTDKTPKDRRFSNPLWETHPYFNYVKQQYLMQSQAMQKAVAGIEGLDAADRKRLTYFADQILNMMAPTNFLGTNPDALERAVATEGESLVRGLENLVRDLEENDSGLLVSLADKDAFVIGDNIAATEGGVVYRNRMFELIQYKPATEKVHAIPLVIFPPWINKFYVMDLRPENSLIRWIVDQGFTLFVVSWKNPDRSYADVGLIDYVEEGYLAAINETKRITGQKKVNAVGYCIAGTTLSIALSLMKQRGDKSINSATFLTTLTDFSDPGEVGVFLDEGFVGGIEAEVRRAGFLDKYYMSRTFSYLRSNDLIYAPAVRSYLLGESPPAFDLLFWNGDGTNLPARMAVEYLRGLCQGNGLLKGDFQIGGTTVSLSDIQVPLCAIACETDHIAGWRASYTGIQNMGSTDKTFILSESGHIAGIINPPSKGKYGHFTNASWPASPAEWKAGAERHAGSWWPRWGEWLAGKSGARVAARPVGDGEHPVLAPAPGLYVGEVPGA
jgi:polyhydroxyalkanoate synthase